MKQLQHTEVTNTQQTFPITIVCDAIRTPENIGMCFRIAESFGVEKIYLHETSPATNNRNVKRTARNTEQHIVHERYQDFETLLHTLKTTGHTIVGIEITDQSTNLQQFNFRAAKKLVLLLGSERNGLQNTQLLDHTVAIPMYGKNSSMNVVHSLSIVLYEATNQLIQDIN